MESIKVRGKEDEWNRKQIVEFHLGVEVLIIVALEQLAAHFLGNNNNELCV